MGGCCSYEISCGGKVIRHNVGRDYGGHREQEEIVYGDCGARIRIRGSSRFVSMYSQQGSKGINQDALTVWENFTGEKDMIFCGVFDGHGPLGHKVSHFIRDNLPSKLSSSIKVSQQKKFSKYYDACAPYRGTSNEDNQNMTLASWECNLIKTFQEMDEDVAQYINTDSFSSGTTAVTVIQQGDHLIIGNLGDSRAILCTRGENDQLTPVQLTVDLKPDIPSEALRIQNCEGRVFAAVEESQVYRVYMPDEDCPGLAMSRAFGDFCLKDYGLISVPEVFYRKITKQDEFVVLASDGDAFNNKSRKVPTQKLLTYLSAILSIEIDFFYIQESYYDEHIVKVSNFFFQIWDVLSNTEVINIVASAPRRSMAAKMLVRHAVATWRYKHPSAKVDDCAAICLFLTDQPPPPPSSNCPSDINSSLLSRHRKQLPPLPHGSKSIKLEDTDTCLDDGKSSVVDLGQDITEGGFRGLSQANSVSNSKQPRISRVVSRRQSTSSSSQYNIDGGVEVH
ncbi:putative protein phosphatase 2C 65 [Senna tora]|uniref:PPM-type phosphatase domain-containing protein n=1 Tax=Senna tora TaxID=362788 RepID=A0A834XH36_9FABA|nr:putative protein phosphatase 2C 65 [Senna tora]